MSRRSRVNTLENPVSEYNFFPLHLAQAHERLDSQGEILRAESRARACVLVLVLRLQRDSMHLVSINAASWIKTVEVILEHYPGGVSEWMERHAIDILCVQEVKVAVSALKTDRSLAEKLGAYVTESFWNAPTDKAARGWNGVATLVRAKGRTLRATTRVLQDAHLDAQGRAIMTDHGAFVVFNVYVPCSADSEAAWHLKRSFLQHLRSSMQQQRAQGKAVILAGDLNIAYRAQDQFWRWRMVDLQLVDSLSTLCCEPSSNRCCPLCDFAKLTAPYISDILDLLAPSLSSKDPWPLLVLQRADMRQERDAQKGRLFIREEEMKVKGVLTTRFWVYAVSAKTHKPVRLGKSHDCLEDAQGAFHLHSREVVGGDADALDDNYSDVDDRKGRGKIPTSLSLGELVELLQKVFEVVIPEQLAQQLGSGCPVCPCVATLLQRFSDFQEERLFFSRSRFRHWISDELIRQDGMVDSFTAFWPNERERFTCWDQYKNSRYSNAGARIDFILVDRGLFDRSAVRGAANLVCGSGPQAALKACTAKGAWQPVPMNGGGMELGTKSDHDTQFFMPHTGLIYFPPRYSDHIGVSLLLHDDCWGADGALHVLERDPFTKEAQPHLVQNSIMSFLQKPPKRKAKRTLGECVPDSQETENENGRTYNKKGELPDGVAKASSVPSGNSLVAFLLRPSKSKADASAESSGTDCQANSEASKGLASERHGEREASRGKAKRTRHEKEAQKVVPFESTSLLNFLATRGKNS
ncbi:DNA-(apurinic or apyrimidinic site) lyase [Porphyridium purpureum]|uniref:DNA-(Apurinic or apyrimidinic site) lyase n=1 Tax=Porphyridium purpureum TaxID=35688 RepID=A0A5J4YPG6_PORPP|nr:DNA-(apurinic or apyrimidinic site) lyase [Porphyridium purpureum]|eukprot:POR3314..scf295_9